MLGFMKKKTAAGRRRTTFRGAGASLVLSALAGAGASFGVRFLEYPDVAVLAAGVGAAALTGGVAMLVAGHLIRRSMSGSELTAHLEAAQVDADLISDLAFLGAASSRKNWADIASAKVAKMTGSAGAAIILRTPGTDSMSLAGSTLPLLIRNLDAAEATPHGPGRRAISTGEPVVMSAGDIPAWAAAAGFEAGAVLPILHHGESIGLAYALGKSWQTPRKEAMRTAARFLDLAATHYAVAAPYAGATAYRSEPEPRAHAVAATRQPNPGPVRTAERISSWPTRQAPTAPAQARTAPVAPVPAPQPARPAVPTVRPVERQAPAPASSSRWLPKAVISAGEATQDAPTKAAPKPEPSAPSQGAPAMARQAQPEAPPAPRAAAPQTITSQPAPVVLPVGQAAAAAQAATEEAVLTTSAHDMSIQRRRLDLPGIALDPRTERCVVDGNALSLSKTEFDLLYALAVRHGDITTGSDLISAVWGDSTTAPNNALDVTIHRLRRKLSRVPGGSDLVKTVRGKGYTLALTG